MNIKPWVVNETNQIKTVVLGIANDLGPTPTLEEAYDPKSKEHIRNGTYPLEEELIIEMDGLLQALESNGVEVIRPTNLKGVHQIYARDIGFVIDDIFIVPNIVAPRSEELDGIKELIKTIDPAHVVHVPEGVRIEGGDVMPWNDKIFVGYSDDEDFEKFIVSRTNKAGVEFLRKQFPNRKVHGFELKKSDKNPYTNALHLDCCFQPIGTKEAIIYRGGFKHKEDYKFLAEFFGYQHLIELDSDDMYNMHSNIFSISPTKIISETTFHSLNKTLRKKGYEVIEVKYNETSKMEGLFRCSTMPIIRE